MKSKLAVLFASALLFAAAPIFANTVTYSFGGPDGDIGTPVNFAASGIQITAYGWVNGAANNLYRKDDSASENGIGLAGQSNNEINPPSGSQLIIFDLTNLVAAGANSGTIALGSLQSGEEGDVCVASSLANAESNTATSCVGPVAESGSTGIGSGTVSWGSDDFIYIRTDANQSASAGNLLVESLQTNVPTAAEPGTFGLLALVLVGFGLISARQFAGQKG